MAALLVASAACLLACASEAPPARGGGQVVIGVRGDVSSFNIYTATNAFSQEVIDLLSLRLAEEQEDFAAGPPSFRPALAASWETSPDRLTLTFRIDPAARWSDGRPVTADDVLLSHRAASSPEVGWVGSDVKEAITEVTAPDPRTVVYHFRRDDPYELMNAVEGNIVPGHLLGTVPLSEWPKRPFEAMPVSSGPFLLERYEREATITLARNPAYMKAPLPHLDRVVFRVIPDEETLVNELLSGGLDVMENIPVRALGRIEASPRLRVVRVPDLSYGYICWNTSRPLFSDARVRRALTLAIDRRAIIETLLPGVGRPSAGPILSFLWAADPQSRPLPYDLDAARSLLREAGWEERDGDGILDKGGRRFRFEMLTNQGSGLRADIVQMAAAQLRKAGVEVVPRTLTMGALVERQQGHDFDAYVSSWRESTRVDLKSAFHSASIEGGSNHGRYSNPNVDRLIDRARAERDSDRARALWWDAQRLIVQDQPYTFLFERDRLHAFPRRLAGVRPGPRSAYLALEEWRWEAAPEMARDRR